MRAGESKKAEEARKVHQRHRQATGKPSKSTTGQLDQAATRQERGAGVAEEDRGGEGCTNHIRIAIVQLSGV